MIFFIIIFVVGLAVFFAGIRIVRPTSRGLIETLGKYSKFAEPGFHWILIGVQKIMWST